MGAPAQVWPILVVDDEPIQRETMAVWLKEDGYRVDVAASGERAIEMAERSGYRIYFLDLKMPPGIDDAAFVIITAYATVDTAVTAIKSGANEYLVKPCNPQEISLLVERLIKLKSLEDENRLLREQLASRYRFHDIISKNPAMHRIVELVRDVADLPSTVLIQGESGTGKEILARAIHQSGSRGGRPFVAVSCGALSETLLESELFGHERGAFTGAIDRRRGKFELAEDGTLLLDEIADISPKLQVDLLRVLQERRFCRVGGNDEIPVEARIIAISNVDLGERVRSGRFRSDLYYRLNVVAITVPPLRDRMEDVAPLAHHFLADHGAEMGKHVRGISEDAMARLLRHDWPGNVRELEHAVERAMVTARGESLTANDFAFLEDDGRGARWEVPAGLPLGELERLAIVAALRREGGNVKRTAEALGIDRSTLYEKIKRYAIPRP
jgi:DNA-binding NtrC family response regulator